MKIVTSASVTLDGTSILTVSLFTDQNPLGNGDLGTRFLRAKLVDAHPEQPGEGPTRFSLRSTAGSLKDLTRAI
jgi:hypothetical protein